MTRMLTAFLAGALFALGLGLGGMTQPTRVVGFLDVAGRWDPSLAFVMMGAVTVYAVLFRLVRRRARPVLSPAFAIPGRRDVDARLVVGAAVFGAGWGLAGYCPGAGIVSLATGATPVLVFVSAILAGMAIADAVASSSATTATTPRRRARLDAKEGTA
jgi:uncharacterized membrane protein YedE/YeeE